MGTMKGTMITIDELNVYMRTITVYDKFTGMPFNITVTKDDIVGDLPSAVDSGISYYVRDLSEDTSDYKIFNQICDIDHSFSKEWSLKPMDE